jgi:FixJ family two-component response regulator
MQTQSVIYVVDDDHSFRTSLRRLLRAAGFDVECYDSVSEFLAAHPGDRPGCVVTDLRMPGLDGLDLQGALVEAGESLPVVFLSAHGDVPHSVLAMKRGAVDFLTKPVESDALFDAIKAALGRDAAARQARVQIEEHHARFETLTKREREILAHVVAGKLNKQIAFDLNIGERTVKAHRASIVRKLNMRSLADLVRFAEAIQIRPPSTSQSKSETAPQIQAS